MVLSHLDDLASVCRRMKISLKCWHFTVHRGMQKSTFLFNFGHTH